MFTFYITGIAWIPSYRDTDQFFDQIVADSEEEAVDQIYDKYPFVKGYHIEKVVENE